MGSFNTKCFVTQQMITPNTKSVIFPIIQKSTYEAADLVYGDKEIQKHGITSTTCYSDAFFKYAGPMFFGKYDDYGRFSIDKADNNHRSFLDFFNMLHKKTFVTKEGKNKYRDFSFNFKEMFDPQKKYEFSQLEDIWENVWKVTDENRVYVANQSGDPVQLCFAVMHHETAKYLINYAEKQKTYRIKPKSQKEFFEDYVSEQIDSMDDITVNPKNFIANNLFRLQEIADLRGHSFNHSSFQYIKPSKIKEIVQIFTETLSTKTFADNYEFKKQISEKLFVLLKDDLDHMYINFSLNLMDIKLSPMIYGGQDYDNETGNDYAKMIKEVNQKIKKEIKAKYSEDTEDEEKICAI